MRLLSYWSMKFHAFVFDGIRPLQANMVAQMSTRLPAELPAHGCTHVCTHDIKLFLLGAQYG